MAGSYLLVAEERREVAAIHGHRIYEMVKASCIPFARTLLHLTERELLYNRAYVDLVEMVLQPRGHYFSYTYDLTHSLQRLDNTAPDFRSIPMHLRVS